jgi:hypothetical protein
VATVDGMKLSECAAELCVSETTLVKWIEGGHLMAFLPPGVRASDGRRGPKGYRVLREDWHRFVQAHRFTGASREPAAGDPAEAPSSRKTVHVAATGTDGVRRRGRRSAV